MAHDHHDKMPDHHHPAQSDYLSGPQILPQRVHPNMTVAELIDQQYQAYNAARLNEATRLYVEQMLAPENDVTVGLTMAGTLTPAGPARCLRTLIQDGFVRILITNVVGIIL